MKFRFCFFLLLFGTAFPLFCKNSDRLSIIDEIQPAIELSIQEQYDSAVDFIHNIVKKYPEEPAGYFFLAAVWQSRMMDFETLRWKQEFYDHIDRTISLSKDQIAVDPDNKYAHFYLGAAYSYKSFQLARDKKYFSAVRIALKSIGELNKTIQLDSSFCDPYLGIGSYLYWRSNITKKFSWLPFFSDRREEGIEHLLYVTKCGNFTRWAALSNLAWIYIEEKKYALAIDTANQGLAHFPNSRFYLWPLADAQFLNKQYESAIQTYTALLQSVSLEKVNNHYNEIVLYLKLGKCYYQLEDYEKAFNACMQVLNIEPDEEVRDRAKEKKQQAIKLLAQINNSGKN
ncbi:tetratricopeptide repeat protein [candidate division KSB1 bacterium]|nr:tetratricopeptide repeat protein [candidate division KSB1 bacterium]